MGRRQKETQETKFKPPKIKVVQPLVFKNAILTSQPCLTEIAGVWTLLTKPFSLTARDRASPYNIASPYFRVNQARSRRVQSFFSPIDVDFLLSNEGFTVNRAGMWRGLYTILSPDTKYYHKQAQYSFWKYIKYSVSPHLSKTEPSIAYQM